MSELMDPNEIREVQFTLSPTAVAAGETITAHTILAPAGITVAPPGRPTVMAPGKVTVWLTGGTDGATYTLVCRTETSAGRIADTEYTVRILDKTARAS